MPSKDLLSLPSLIKDISARQADERPRTGVVHAIDGGRIDIRIDRSILRNIEVFGDAGDLSPGQTVALEWRGNRPIAIPALSASSASGGATVVADGQSLEFSPQGLRVKVGGIALRHLNFVPVLEGNLPRDMMARAGWMVREDGALYQDDIFLHPWGQISLGTGSSVIKLDARHDEYRMWVGASVPEDATFRVTKDGRVEASAGDIAGWEILSDRLAKNGAELRASGELVLGSDNQVAILSGADVNGWRLWIGHQDPTLAPFRVNQYGQAWIEDAVLHGALQSDNYVAGLSGWRLSPDGRAELGEAVIRGRVSTAVFSETAISAISGQMILSPGVALIAPVAPEDLTIDVDANSLASDQIIHLKPDAERNEYMRVTSAPEPITGGFRYGVERNLNGMEAPSAFYAGEVCVGKGVGAIERFAQPLAAGEEGGALGNYQPGGSGGSSGGGWLELDGQTPFFGVVARYGPVWDQVQRVVQIGNLVGSPLGAEYTTETWGAFFGDENDYMVYDAENGLRIRFSSGAASTSISKAGLSTEAFRLKSIAGAPDYEDGYAAWYLGADFEVRVRLKDGATEIERVLGDSRWVQGRPVDEAAPGSGQVLMWNATTETWEPNDVSAAAPPATWTNTTYLSKCGSTGRLLSMGGDKIKLGVS